MGSFGFIRDSVIYYDNLPPPIQMPGQRGNAASGHAAPRPHRAGHPERSQRKFDASSPARTPPPVPLAPRLSAIAPRLSPRPLPCLETRPAVSPSVPLRDKTGPPRQKSRGSRLRSRGSRNKMARSCLRSTRRRLRSTRSCHKRSPQTQMRCQCVVRSTPTHLRR